MWNALTSLTARAIRVASIGRPGDVVERAREQQATHFVVMDEDGSLSGIVPMQAAALASPLRIFADLIPTRPSPKVEATAELKEVARLLGDAPDASVVVENAEGVFLGIVTKDSLLPQLLAEQTSLTAKVAQMAEERSAEAKLLEVKVAERTAELATAMEEMEVFSYSLSHDLKAPLLRMISYAEMVIADHGEQLPKGVRVQLERISVSGEHLVRLIRDIQAFVQVSKLPMVADRILTSSLIKDVLDFYRVYLEEKAVELQVDSIFPDVYGQYASLFQVVGNLLYNAAKFVPPNTRPQIALRAEAIGGKVRIKVEDSGIGVPADCLDRLFKPFTRLHGAEHYEGTGLGLAFARVAMKRMGGAVGYEPRPGGGSIFWIELPAAEESPVARCR